MLYKHIVYCFLILQLLFSLRLSAQSEVDSLEILTEKIQTTQSDSATINAYRKFVLRISKKNLEKQFNYIDKNNMIVNMYKLNYSLDTIEAEMLDYIDKDPIHACNDIKWHKGIKSYRSFMNLHKKFYAQLDCRCKEEWAKLDSNLIKLLVVMDSLDQKYRKNPSDAPWIVTNKEKWIEQEHYDAYNQILLEHIFVTYGYPTYRKIGVGDIEQIPFGILLHCDVAFQEKYLKLVKTVSDSNEIPKYFYGQVIDRIMVKKGKAQIYGTQLIWNKKSETLELYQVKDMTKVDRLRKEIGLNSLASFLKSQNAIIQSKNKK
jgi:hypothetical protein